MGKVCNVFFGDDGMPPIDNPDPNGGGNDDE